MQSSAPGKMIDPLRSACQRLAGAGWGELLARHGLDIEADDLANELAKPLPKIDRTLPGFEDFAWEGARAIEPGQPGRSLLFHALASPQVLTWPSPQGHRPLDDYPTPAEIQAVENYVYGVRPPSIEDLRAAAGNAPLAIVVYAAEYRPAIGTVHGKHADMCFSRTGVARVGTERDEYRADARGYLPFGGGDGNRIRVLPCRYAPYIAALLPGEKYGHGPARFIETEDRSAASDGLREFWVPLHKLFDGDECIRGRELSVVLTASHVNEKLRRAHLFFLSHGHNGGWCEPDISNPPFVFTDGIASFSGATERDGNGLLMPHVHDRLVEPAEYDGKPLTYVVPATKSPDAPWRPYPRVDGSSLNLKPGPSGARAAPEYLHARHKIDDEGRDIDLNESPDMPRIVREGGYRARHYLDYTGDGWVGVECGELALDLPRRLSAYSIVATPDFFPAVKQSDLMEWTGESVPPGLLETIWPAVPGRPEALSDQRLAANLELDGAAFDAADQTMTAIVGQFRSGSGRLTQIDRAKSLRASPLTDAAAGIFAPGWDVSPDRTSETEPDSGTQYLPGVTFLTTYGLGSPFPEDAKLCAALSSFWPAVAPDITRTFEPSARYATATPLPDEEIGLDSADPWDGILGPQVDRDKKVVEYNSLSYADYVQTALDDRFNLTVVGTTGLDEYAARTLTMARVYETLGATTTTDKVKWVVLSFRTADPADPDLEQACEATGRRVHPKLTYRFEMFEHKGRIRPHPDKAKFAKKCVEYDQIEVIFADPVVVLRRENGDWKAS